MVGYYNKCVPACPALDLDLEMPLVSREAQPGASLQHWWWLLRLKMKINAAAG